MNLEGFKAFLQYIFPKKALTLFAGLLAEVQVKLVKGFLISSFIKNYDVNMREAQIEDIDSYPCFNDFFIRKLKPECRPIAQAPFISPVDGYISETGRINSGKLIQAKGHDYTVEELLAGDKELSSRFLNGKFATLYLSPQDYHRVHMPIAGQLQQMVYVPGSLFSVNPASTKNIPKLFARNERCIAYFETELGMLAMVLVGATVVGSIGTSWHGDVRRSKHIRRFDYTREEPRLDLAQAEEMGYFKLGSTVILLLENTSKLSWLNNLSPGKRVTLFNQIGDI